MSPLQLGLWVVGALVVVGVLVYNWWSTRQLLPKRAEATRSNAEPIDEGLEPWLGDTLTSHADTPAYDENEVQVASKPAKTLRPMQVLDSRIDVIVPMELDTPVSGDAVLAAAPTTRRIGSKPFYIEGLELESGAWELPRAGQRYSALRAGVQMANRSGPLNEIEFSEFVVKLQDFADTVQAEADFPDMLTEVSKARELDQFASRHDAQLSFLLSAQRAAWSPGYLTQHAAKLGFVPGALPGRLVLPASEAGAAPVLVLSFETQAALADDPSLAVLRVFNLSLDMPHVNRAEEPFSQLRHVALTLCERMEGILTDDNGTPVSPEALDRIGADIERLYSLMDQYDLPAGSPVCRRLFS
jgi:hypothetical protein